MTTLTLNLPDEVGARIKEAAAAQGISVDTWVTDAAMALINAKARFQAAAAMADVPATLALLDRLDREAEANRRAAEAEVPCNVG